MYIKLVLVVMLVLILSAAGVYVTQHAHLEEGNSAATFSQNANLLGRYAGTFAGAHQPNVGAVSPSTLGTPSWYTPYPGLGAYVYAGNAYVYLPPGGSLAPNLALTYVAGPGILAGIKSGSSIFDGTGRALATSVPIPGAIPDGSMVLVTRDVLPATSQGTPSYLTQPSPGWLPAGAPLSGPQTFAGFTSTLVPWSPNSPPWTNPPNSTIAATPPPPPPPVNPPPSVPAFTVGIYGGYTYTMGRKTGTCTLGSFNTFVRWNSSIGNPADSYALTMTRAGQTVSVTLPSSQIQCAASCAGNGAMLTSSQAIGFTPDISWSKLVYASAVQSGSSYTFYPYMLDMTVSLKACNANGCTTTNETAKNLEIFSMGTSDCTAATGGNVYYPPTAYP